jgi:spore maturation protein CgeB
MKQKLNFRFFAHSWVSDWNHGNAHFLRGLARSLVRMGHNVRCYEELGSWSLSNLVQQEGEMAIDAIDEFRHHYPELDIRFYKYDATFNHFADQELRDADIVVIHEWNRPEVVNSVLARKKFGFRTLLHDTHHRAYSSAGEMLRFQLHLFDGVLAFGEAIRRIYTDGFGIPHAWTFHEAADVTHFHPFALAKNADVVWIGNWGDDERTRELQEYLIGPAATLNGCKVLAYGVRYPEDAKAKLEKAGIEYRGYLPNLRTPKAYAESTLSLHVPRRQYANGLSGIPTIRVFEALACGTPLLCSPWTDAEGLFRPGEDYLVVRNGREMAAAMRDLLADDEARRQIAANGLETIQKRHTCTHRAAELVNICEELGK